MTCRILYQSYYPPSCPATSGEGCEQCISIFQWFLNLNIYTKISLGIMLIFFTIFYILFWKWVLKEK